MLLKLAGKLAELNNLPYNNQSNAEFSRQESNVSYELEEDHLDQP